MLGTALASTLIALPMLTATPAQAQTVTCTGGPPPGNDPILEANVGPIVCVNNDNRSSNAVAPDAIFLVSGSYIYLTNSGNLQAATNTFLFGSNAVSAFSKVDIVFGEDTEGYIASGGFSVQW